VKYRYAIAGLAFGCLTLLASANAQTDWPSFGNDPGAMRYSPLTQINTKNVTQLKLAWKFDMQVVNPVPSAAPSFFPGAPEDAPQAPGARPQGGQAEAAGQAPGAQAQGAPGAGGAAGAAGPAGAGGAAGAARRGQARNPNAPRGSESIPLVVNNVLYISTAYRQVVALNAQTGEKIWEFNSPHPPPSRGISYWPGTTGFPAEIVYGTPDGFLVALDAKTGKPATTFGDGGLVDLKAGLATDKFPTPRVGVSSPVGIYKNYVIPGCSPGEAPAFGTPCDIRAFDMRTGKLVWTFHTLPRPGEANHEVWKDGEWENRAGLNNWGFMSVDPERGTIFVPVGTPNTDFYGGNRSGSNLYGSTLLALDGNTGKLKWYFQTTHHDNWDYDETAAPILFNVKQHGKTIPAVAQLTKQALVFILNRDTGKPIFGVKEVPVANDNASPGDSNWPTQPMPVKPPPVARDTFSPDEIATVTPEHEQYCKDLLAQEGGAMTGGPFAQYGPKLRVIFPSWTGGINWGGGFFDPKLGYLFVDTKDLANFSKVVPQPNGTYRRVGPDNAPKGLGDYYWDGVKHWPCQQPPWARLVAVNVNTGDIAWQVPLGSFDELDKLGVPKTGTPTTNGGGIATGGGLVFIGSTTDGKFRAFDSRNGKELWVNDLGVDVNSIPITWQGKDGKQYLAVNAGGGAHNGAKPTILYVYSLP
jgi:quinoprotein glucose dehydrogenase